MQTLLIIQELHGLARDSILGYEKVMRVWNEKPEHDEIENIQVNRRVILQELRKTIERHKGDLNAMAPSEGYKAINERKITGHLSEVRGTLDDLLRGENYYLYRIEDAQTRYPDVTAHLNNIHSTVQDNRNLLSLMLSREAFINSISIDNPSEQVNKTDKDDTENHLITTPINEMVIKTHTHTPIPTPHYSGDLVHASDAEIPISFRNSANLEEAGPLLDSSKEDERQEVENERGIIEADDVEEVSDEKILEVTDDEENNVEIVGKINEAQVLDNAEKTHSFEYDIKIQSSDSDVLISNFQVDEQSDHELEFEIEDAFKPRRNSIIRKRGSFDA